jgi:hypothetical protein
MTSGLAGTIDNAAEISIALDIRGTCEPKPQFVIQFNPPLMDAIRIYGHFLAVCLDDGINRRAGRSAAYRF